jgi:hypothetical protein
MAGLDTITVRLTRESVCAGDDCDSPHYSSFDISPSASVKNLIEKIISSGYLAEVENFTWDVSSTKPLAGIRVDCNHVEYYVQDDLSITEFGARNGVFNVRLNLVHEEPLPLVRVIQMILSWFDRIAAWFGRK